MKFRSHAIVAALAAAALALTGCASASSSNVDGSGTATGGTLIWGVTAAPTNFSAQAATWGPGAILGTVYDTVLKETPDGKIQPDLATKWSYNADKTKLTLTIRSGVKFTDGTTLDAAAVAQNLTRFRDGTSGDAALLSLMTSAVAENKTTVVITLSAPDPSLLISLAQDAGLVESPAAFNSPDVATIPVGSGPYIYKPKSSVIGSSYVFDRNPHYWNPGDQHYKEIEWKVYTDPTALLDAVQGKQVNVAYVADNTTVPAMKAAGYKANIIDLDTDGLLLLDRAGKVTPAMGDVRVRQAINLAFNRPLLLKTLGGGYGTVTEQVFPTYLPSFDKKLDNYYAYDIAKAKKLMADAGYPNGFTLNMPETEALPSATWTILASELANIGITVKYTDLEGLDYYNAVLGAKYSAVFFGIAQEPTDWEIVQYEISPTAPFNPFHSTNTKVQGLISGIQSGDQSAGRELNAYLVKNAWFAPWWRNQNIFISDPNTKVTMTQGIAVPQVRDVKPSR